MWVPRTMVRPRVRFSSVSIRADVEVLLVAAPGAEEEPFVGFRLTRRNSSVSARTRFMCCEKERERVSDWDYRSRDLGGGEEGLGGSYFVESEHLAGHLSAVIESYSHAVVDLFLS